MGRPVDFLKGKTVTTSDAKFIELLADSELVPSSFRAKPDQLRAALTMAMQLELEIKPPKPLTKRTIKPGGVWWDLCRQEIVGYVYYHAECYCRGHMIFITAAMDSPDGVRAHVKRLYPEANEFVE